MPDAQAAWTCELVLANWRPGTIGSGFFLVFSFFTRSQCSHLDLGRACGVRLHYHSVLYSTMRLLCCCCSRSIANTHSRSGLTPRCPGTEG
ncbi:MAG: hypothetical protein J3Q66DRAFT_356411 [Benniella sp.]|nr:MAG: hypothetical protein J3Q66DRAFT_356411 [Benniella sp.]